MIKVNQLLVAEIAEKNSYEYNYDKFFEEQFEFSMELVKLKTKNPKYKPPIEKIHEELAHLYLRLCVLAHIHGVEGVQAELDKKQEQIAVRIPRNAPNDL